MPFTLDKFCRSCAPSASPNTAVQANRSCTWRGCFSALFQALSRQDQITVYNPCRHGEHIQTNITQAQLQRLVQADPTAPAPEDLRRAGRILDIAGVDTTGFPNELKIQLARTLVSHDRTARDIAAAKTAALAGNLNAATPGQLMAIAEAKPALAGILSRLVVDDIANHRVTASCEAVVHLVTNQPILAKQLDALAAGTVQQRNLASKLLSLASPEQACRAATLAREAPASATALNDMILGADLDTRPDLLGTHLQAIAPGVDTPAGREALLELFRCAPALQCKNSAWTANTAHAQGVDLSAVCDQLNGMERNVLVDRLRGLPVDPMDPKVLLNHLDREAVLLARTLHLDSAATNQFLCKVADKIDYGDIRPSGLQDELAAHDTTSLLKVCAETACTQVIAEHIRTLGHEQRVTLLGGLVNPNSAYCYFREGTSRLMEILTGQIPAPLQDAVHHLKSGYWDAARFSSHITANPPNDAAGFEALAAAMDNHAATLVSSLHQSYDSRRQAVHQRLSELLDRVNPQTETAANFQTNTGLSITEGTALKDMLSQVRTMADMDRFARTMTDMDRFARTMTDMDCFASLFGTSSSMPESTWTQDTKKQLAHFRQAASLLDALSANPVRFMTGLEHIAMVLPTAGKPLADLAFVPTMAAELRSVLATCNQLERIRDFPILVFDQTTDPDLLAGNRDYLQQLAETTGARIEHITLQTIQQFEQKLSIPGMFDTTGQSRAGFAGARNIANLLGALLHSRLQNYPEMTVAQVLDLSPAALGHALRQSALTNQAMVLMGDDDASVLPGFLHAKSLIAEENQGSYITSKTAMDGRGTTSGYLVNNLEDFLADQGKFLRLQVMNASCWASTDINPTMAAALSSPGACLNVPVPTEECMFAAYRRIPDILSCARHLAGDRYEDFPARLKGFVSYSSQGNLADTLLQCGRDFMISSVLPWNGRAQHQPFQNLGEIFTYAADPTVQCGMQKAYFRNFLKMESLSGSLCKLATVDYTQVMNRFFDSEHDNLSPRQRREFADVLDGYLAVQADLLRGIEFRDQLVQRLVGEFSALNHADDARWTTINNRLQTGAADGRQEALEYLVDNNHDIGQAIDQTRADMSVSGQDPNMAASPLAQIVFLTAKAIGAGGFNQHMHTITHEPAKE